MIHMVGIGENLKIEIREEFIIPQRHVKEALNGLQEEFDEVVVLSTCNRTELYLNTDMEHDKVVEKIFQILGWNLSFKEHILLLKGKEAVRHIMEVTCGFHSIIMGEDQILGQVRDAFHLAVKEGLNGGYLHRLFQYAIACGKEFKSETMLNEVPVSSSSIAVKIAKERKIDRFMIIGFGEVGKLALKYIDIGDGSHSYIAVRKIGEKMESGANHTFIDFSERLKYYNEVDCIISCTSAPHHVIFKEDLPNRPLLIFDLAVPRDVHRDVEALENVEIIGIDQIDSIDCSNRMKREGILFENMHILDKYVMEYICWTETRNICNDIRSIKAYGDQIYSERYDTYIRRKKNGNDDELVSMLLKSTATTFVNRAIQILKEENQKGSGEECLRILERIFCEQE